LTGGNLLTPCISLSADLARKEEAGWIGGKNQEYQKTNDLKQFCQQLREVGLNDRSAKKNI
jgi:hypothetical protein